MQKMHALNSAIINCMAFDYFYTKEKPDPNGNPRYRVYIMDPDAPAVYEILCKYHCTLFKLFTVYGVILFHNLSINQCMFIVGRYIGRDPHGKPVFQIIVRNK